MRKLLTLLLLLPALAGAGIYEDLEEAMIRHDAPGVIAFVQRGLDVNTVDRSGNTLLAQAIRLDMPELVDFLLKHRARVNLRNRYGETALSLAAFAGRTAYVRRLLEAGAEVNFHGWAPLAYAAWNGHAEVARLLIEYGADIDGKTENGSTPIFFAARYGHPAVVKLLLEHGADLAILNDRDESAVDWAIKGKNTEIEDVLRQAGGRSGKSVKIEVGG